MSPLTRASRGALMTVSIGVGESREWQTDVAFREDMVKDITKRARAKGRRFFEITDARGESLHVGEVSS